MIPISSSNPPVYPTWRWAGEETTHFSLVLKFNRPLPRACYVPGLREAVYLCNLTGFWVDSANGVTWWGPEEERKGESGAVFLLSPLPWTAALAVAASLLRLQLRPCSACLGDSGSSCWARLPPGGPDRSMVTSTPLSTPAPPPRGGSIFLPWLITRSG